MQCASVALISSLLALQLLERALVAPQVDPVAERVPDVPDDVAGVLGGDLLAERRPLLPGRRNRVAELVHQLLVDPEHHLGEVVLDAVLRAVDRALGGRGRRPLAEQALRDEALERRGEVERLLRHPHRVVDLLAEDDIRPAAAGPVPQLDLGLQRRRAVAVAVEGDDVHVHVRMRLGVGLRRRQPDRVDPDGQRARGGPAALPVAVPLAAVADVDPLYCCPRRPQGRLRARLPPATIMDRPPHATPPRPPAAQNVRRPSYLSSSSLQDRRGRAASMTRWRSSGG